MSKLNWKNLKSNRCPQCGKAIKQTPLDPLIRCVICDFAIREDKMSALVASMVKGQVNFEKFVDNFSELNNL